MKAIVLQESARLVSGDVPEPAPGPGQVKVRTRYTGIQWGDVLVRAGDFPVPRPFVPGFDAAGEVVSVGSGVDPSRVGEPVMALVMSGACAEYLVVDSEHAPNVAGIDLRTVAAYGWGAPTAWDLVHSVAHIGPGESVLVHAAAGGVGSLVGQFARLAGAKSVAGVVTTEQLAAFARDHGYDEVLLAADFPLGLGERRFDVVFDPIGGQVRRQNLDLVAPHGRLVLFGNIASAEAVSFTSEDLLLEGKSVLSYKGILLPCTHPQQFRASVLAALEQLRTGSVRVSVGAECAFDDFESAVARLASGTAVGKTVIRIG